MEDSKEIELHRLKRRIVELERRVQRPREWSSGEIELFNRQILNSKNRYREIIDS